MLPKIGDLNQTSNWRTIAILPILYKLFSKTLYNRLSKNLFLHQLFDQHAFIPERRIEDALFCLEIATEFSLEYQTPLWILSMDLRKAFDTIDHSALFAGLRAHDVPEEYIHLIMMLYSKQTGTVNDSKKFRMERGMKQGDILSALFFNCVLDIVFEK